MRRIAKIFLGFFAVGLCSFALLHLLSIPSFPVEYGVSFSSDYAVSLGLDWRETYSAMLRDLRPSFIRIAANWKQIEPYRGEYQFQDLDWMVEQADAAGVRALLVVGQKIPRWPECHYPSWVDTKDPNAKQQFLSYVGAVVSRYRDHASVDEWQVENEPFIRFPFGECANFQESWVKEEIELVHALDPAKNIIVTDSGELGLWWRAGLAGDILGTTVYRFVKAPSGREWSYGWLPGAWYHLRARLFGKSAEEFFIAELQAEPWFTAAGPTDTAVAEQERGFTTERFRDHIEYARHTGASRAYLWGAEWWYFMKTRQNDARYWDIAKEAL